MNTLMQTLSISLIVIGAFLALFSAIGLPMYHSDLKNNQKYRNLYSQSELDAQAETMRRIRRRGPWLVLIFALLVFVGIVGSFVSSRTLTERECETNEGVFESWDSGFQWKCYNPSEIQQNNNFRVILEDGE